MSQNSTTFTKGQGNAMPINSQTPATAPKGAKTDDILSVTGVEVPRIPTVTQVFERIQQGFILQESYEKFSSKLKDLSDFEREAKEETGFMIVAMMPNGKKFEFNHLPSNLEFVSQQVEKGRLYLANLESQIQNFKIS